MLLRDNIPSIPDPNKWQHIGGDLDDGETYDNALLREYEEELSIRPQKFRRLGRLDISKDKIDMLYLVELDNDEVSRLKKGKEGQRFGFFTYAELKRLDLFRPFKLIFRRHLEEILKDPSSADGAKLGLQQDESKGINE